jgi:hypothetical protein
MFLKQNAGHRGHSDKHSVFRNAPHLSPAFFLVLSYEKNRKASLSKLGLCLALPHTGPYSMAKGFTLHMTAID